MKTTKIWLAIFSAVLTGCTHGALHGNAPAPAYEYFSTLHTAPLGWTLLRFTSHNTSGLCRRAASLKKTAWSQSGTDRIRVYLQSCDELLALYDCKKCVEKIVAKVLDEFKAARSYYPLRRRADIRINLVGTPETRSAWAILSPGGRLKIELSFGVSAMETRQNPEFDLLTQRISTTLVHEAYHAAPPKYPETEFVSEASAYVLARCADVRSDGVMDGWNLNLLKNDEWSERFKQGEVAADLLNKSKVLEPTVAAAYLTDINFRLIEHRARRQNVSVAVAVDAMCQSYFSEHPDLRQGLWGI